MRPAIAPPVELTSAKRSEQTNITNAPTRLASDITLAVGSDSRRMTYQPVDEVWFC